MKTMKPVEGVSCQPLVVMDDSVISARRGHLLEAADHQVRDSIAKKPRILGALFGKRRGDVVQLQSALPIPVTKEFSFRDADFMEDQDIHLTALNTFGGDYSGQQCVGWYTTGTKPDAGAAKFHEAFKRKCKGRASVLLLVDPKPDVEGGSIPIRFYQNAKGGKLGEVGFNIEMQPAAHIAVDETMKAHTQTSYGGSKSAPRYRALRSACGALHERLKVLYQYLDDIEKGKAKASPSILSSIKGVVNRLPLLSDEGSQADFAKDFGDNLSLNYLAGITAGSAGLNEVLELYSQMSERTGLV